MNRAHRFHVESFSVCGRKNIVCSILLWLKVEIETTYYTDCSSSIYYYTCNYKHELCLYSVFILFIMVDKFMMVFTRWWKLIFRIFQQNLQVKRSNSESLKYVGNDDISPILFSSYSFLFLILFSLPIYSLSPLYVYCLVIECMYACRLFHPPVCCLTACLPINWCDPLNSYISNILHCVHPESYTICNTLPINSSVTHFISLMYFEFFVSPLISGKDTNVKWSWFMNCRNDGLYVFFV